MTVYRLHRPPIFGASRYDKRFSSPGGANVGKTRTRGKASGHPSSAQAGKQPQDGSHKEGIICGVVTVVAASALLGEAEVGSAGTQPMEE